MTNYYYPDTNHEDTKVTDSFRADLTDLAGLGVKTIFMEFLEENVPENKELIEHFATCANGRRFMAKSYCACVIEARRLNMKVVGLAHGAYTNINRQREAGFTFRMMGPFDAIAASIIERNAGTEPYAVFLGSGHWPLLSYLLPGMQLRIQVQESMPTFADIKESETFLVSAHQVAKIISRGASEATFIARGCKGAKALDTIAAQWQAASEYVEVYAMAQDKLGVPPDMTQINYMIAKRGARFSGVQTATEAQLRIASNPSVPYKVTK